MADYSKQFNGRYHECGDIWHKSSDLKYSENKREKGKKDSKEKEKSDQMFLGKHFNCGKNCRRRMIAQNLLEASRRLTSHWIRKKAINWFYALQRKIR